MPKNLVIVESPAKAKTIEKYLGKDFSVKSSFGHIRDLPKKGMSIDVEHDFMPIYEISPEKKKVVAELKKAALGADVVWLASDEDREGEAIAWHLHEALKLNSKNTKRIVFHEITKPAIENAVKNPRDIDMGLVNAQQARRILDRVVGYELSPVLWKKVKSGLSAGRVQSVTVRLIVEREREINGFNAADSYRVSAIFQAKGEDFSADLKTNLSNNDTARKFLEAAADASFKIEEITKKPATRNPSAPFITSSLQQEAARRLGYSVKQTMTLAQRLYENGHITYMRTDSTIMSVLALAAAESYIKKNFGDKYHQRRQYKTKNAGAQEAHEAIRPTDFSCRQAGEDSAQQKLYKLIWERTLASQMTGSQIERTEAIIQQSNRPEKFVAKGEILKFEGFLKVYGKAQADTILPPLNKNDPLTLVSMDSLQTYSRPPARYSEAGLVKKLEELGIGRPSTYAPTISTVQTRGYVEKRNLEGHQRVVIGLSLKNQQIKQTEINETTGADKNKLLPTYLAEITTDFLMKYFAPVVDYDFTAKAESQLDLIAEGKQAWVDMLKDFYKDFHPLIQKSETISRQEASQAKLLGNHPKTDQPIFARFGRYGPMLQMGQTESEQKPIFAPMPKGTTIEEVSLEQALPMFELPRTVGTTTDGQEIKANIGRFGPYIQVGKLFVSTKDKDPLTITEAESRELYETKKEADANKTIRVFDNDIKILNGPYGPYVTDGKKNARIPKSTDPKKLTAAQSQELLVKAPAKSKRFAKKRKR